ncbi:MAG: DUF3612 domain-containing protein [Candidatus Marinimicrobia bacterium]|nr:DUF3612 domain-containing protein [Candidatus Neomarinimicrobiota bacterium]MDP7026228.1 DUF3612 domain-containing protein [Candidatus Neomarinimicrobiota bacterium]|tara:strand:- start:404 stop:1954 length:1551 start_codon:yes stop_codon:yes gene_type:complete
MNKRKSHFFGIKLRKKRQDSGLTLEDLMNRCIAVNAENAPSISYLSLLETGRRYPTDKLLDIFCEVFSETTTWFIDDSTGIDEVDSHVTNEFILEPRVLFDKSILSRAIPDVLTQTGTSGRRFAYALISALRERQKNHFPDLEREAESLGNKKLPMDLNTIFDICKRVNLKIKWFDNPPVKVTVEEAGEEIRSLVRSFFQSPDTIWINKRLEKQQDRLKFEISLRLAHMVLHGGDGIISDHATGGELGAAPEGEIPPTFVQHQRDVLVAWRDYECSYFASALLLPRQLFKRFLIRSKYDVTKTVKLGYTPSLIMRRMTSVSPYRHWHYFDVYPPNFVRVYYRGNNIPLPHHHDALHPDSICIKWGIFQATNNIGIKHVTQLSLMKNDEMRNLYACYNVPTRDAAGNRHVLGMGIDLQPALESTGKTFSCIIDAVEEHVVNHPGKPLKDEVQREFKPALGLLNMGFANDAVGLPPEVICTWARICPRTKKCVGAKKSAKFKSPIEKLRDDIVEDSLE